VTQKHLLPEALVDLRRRLSTLAPRSPERRQVLRETAHLYGVSEDTVYRALRERFRPRALRRADHGQPRVMSRDALERYCEIGLCRKFCSGGPEGAVALVCGGITRPGNRTVQPQCGLLLQPPFSSVVS
jgi:hypothetical protein